MSEFRSPPGGPGDPLEQALRRSLARNATQGPDPDEVTRRILAAADAPVDLQARRRRRYGVWGLPLVAAATVAAVVGGVLAVSQLRTDTDGKPAVGSTPTHTASPTPDPTPPAPSSDQRGGPGPVVGTGTGSATTSRPADTHSLTGVQVLDLTFTGADTGWALASADCILTSGRCPALLHTGDGRTWVSRDEGTFAVPGTSTGCPAATCVSHVRFANAEVGYAFGPDALYLTTDGARSWRKLPGGAEALETLSGNVIRVRDASSCSSGCRYTVQTARIGSTRWSDVRLPGAQGRGDGVKLVRSGDDALIGDFGRPVGSAGSARAVLWSSSDDGASWTRRGEPCPQSAGSRASTEVDSVDLTAADDGSFTVACRPRTGTATPFTITTTDSAAGFSRGAGLPGSDTAPLVAAASRHTLLAVNETLYRSTDRGQGWSSVGAVPIERGASFAGFENADVGRIVTDDGRIIWTTRDAGLTWSEVNLP